MDKSTYYIIEVYEESSIKSGEYTFVGYFTNLYSVNKIVYAGYDSNKEYDRVKRFKTLKSATSFVNKLNNGDKFGGESFTTKYSFKIVSVQLSDLSKSNIRIKASKEVMQEAKQFILNSVLGDNIDKLKTFCTDKEYSEEESNEFYQAVYYLLSKII